MFPLAIFIGGPTASGKTELAFSLHSKIPSYVVNADSMQVYNRLNILTNKPSEKEIKNFDCKLFSFLHYPEKCSVGLWRKKCIELLKNMNRVPIFVGGTGLYIESLINNISEIPQISNKIKSKINKIFLKRGKNFFYQKLLKIDNNYAKKISSNDTQRIQRAIEVKVATGKSFSDWHKQEKKKLFKRIIYVVINTEREILYKKINQRCKNMINNGILEEVENFLEEKSVDFHPLHKAIGLNPISQFLQKRLTKEDCISMFMQDTRRYAKRQLTWFNNRAKSAKHLGILEAENYILQKI